MVVVTTPASAGGKNPYLGSRLVDILADMLRTALAWEEEHNCRAAETDGGQANALTPLQLPVHCSPHPEERRGGRNPLVME